MSSFPPAQIQCSRGLAGWVFADWGAWASANLGNEAQSWPKKRPPTPTPGFRKTEKTAISRGIERFPGPGWAEQTWWSADTDNRIPEGSPTAEAGASAAARIFVSDTCVECNWWRSCGSRAICRQQRQVREWSEELGWRRTSSCAVAVSCAKIWWCVVMRCR